MRRRALRSILFAAVVVFVVWAVGGPVGALLDAPGLLALDGARRLGIWTGSAPSLRGWLWLGTGISAVFWALTAYVALAATDRRAGGRA